MPGMILYQFRQGDRSEYLALYILSALGLAINVPRTEDIGVDFYCSLAMKDCKRLTFHSPFLVQIKSSGITKIKYGGPAKTSRKWKKEEIEWLFNQELPLFIGIVDKKKRVLKLFGTSNMWAGYYMDARIGEIVLRIDQPRGNHEVFTPEKAVKVSDWPEGIGNGKRLSVPLGPAIVSLSLDDCEAETKLDRYRHMLKDAIQIEQENITYRRLKVHFSKWPHRYSTNKLLEGVGLNLVANPVPGANTEHQLESIKPIIATLAFNYKSQGQIEELLKLKPVIQLLRRDHIINLLEKTVPELFQ